MIDHAAAAAAQEAGAARGVEAHPVDLRAVCDKLLAEIGVARKVKSERPGPADPVPAVRFEIASAEENTPEAAMLRFSMVFLIAIALWTNVSVGGYVG